MRKESRKQLKFEVDFLKGILERNQNHIDCLKVLAHDYTRMGRYEEGLEMDLRLADLCAEDPMVHYNLACSYSCTGNLDESVAELSRAILLGYKDFDHMLADKDLIAVRETEVFKELLEKKSALS
jgi:tetratricopeptide (TPR) repeat protein